MNQMQISSLFLEMKFILVFLCSSWIFVTGSKSSSPPNEVEHFLMVKVNESDVFPCVLRAASAVRKSFGKHRGNEEMKEFWKGPSMCANCVVCAAMVFGLMKAFVEGKSSSASEDELDVICDRRLPMYRMWDVSGMRYFGEPTVNARQVLRHESLTPSIQNVCQTMKNMTTGRQLYDLWRQDKARFMNRLCFNPYFYPGLASCRGLLKRTRGIDRMKVCRKPLYAYVLEWICYRDPKAYKYCEEKEYHTILSWYTLGNHDYNE